MDGLDDRLDALLALGREPLLERSLRAHRFVEALGERDALDALALLREARLEQRDLLPQLELLLGVVAEERVRHVVVRADALPRIGQLEDRLEDLLDAVFEVAHATILSAYSRELAQGSESCTRLPATWYSSLRNWCSRRSSCSTSAGRIRNMRQSGDATTLLGLMLLVAHRVQQVEEAALRQVVRGELLDDAATQEPEVDGDLEQARGDALQSWSRSRRARSCRRACRCRAGSRATSSGRTRNVPASYAGKSQF